jgi:hypothetical protein
VLEVKSIDRLLGTPVSDAYAVKAGPWIFLTGHEAYDWETGIPDEVAGAPGFPLYGRSGSRRDDGTWNRENKSAEFWREAQQDRDNGGNDIGGLSIVLFGLIAAMAGRIWVEN